MRTIKRLRHAGFPLTALLACSLVFGCASDDEGGTPSGSRDASADAGRDVGRSDTGTADSGARDTGTVDTGRADTGGSADTGRADAEPAEDTGTADTGGPPEDTGVADTGSQDTGSPDTGTADTGTADTGTADTGTADTSTGDTAGGCDLDGFDAVADFAVRFDDEDVDIPDAMFYRAFDTEDEPWNELDLEFYDLDTDWPGPGSFDFTGENYADCFTCGLLFTGCTEENIFCDAVYLAVDGTLNITAVGEIGGSLTGTLTNAQFVEVEIDWEDTFESTVVPGGETWCVDSFSFDVEVLDPEG